MKYFVSEEVFAALPHYMVGVVAATGIAPLQESQAVAELFAKAQAQAAEKYCGVKVKEQPELAAYREAFRAVGINPNKYPSSIEALLTRISKGKMLAPITPLVDLGNAVSLLESVPIGAHAVDSLAEGTLGVRRARENDTFVPFGETVAETPDLGEIVYASGTTVRTRHFLWRQSELGKITPETKDILYLLDGFSDRRNDLERGRDLLAKHLTEVFHAQVKIGLITKYEPEFIF